MANIDMKTLTIGSDTFSFVDQTARTNASSAVTTANAAATNANRLPAVSSADNGKFLRVSGGAWTAVVVSSAEGVSF